MAGLAAAAVGAFLPMLLKGIGLDGGRSRGAGRSLSYGGRRRRRRRRHRRRRYRGGGGICGMRWGYKRCRSCRRRHKCRGRTRHVNTHKRWK